MIAHDFLLQANSLQSIHLSSYLLSTSANNLADATPPPLELTPQPRPSPVQGLVLLTSDPVAATAPAGSVTPLRLASELPIGTGGT